MSIIETLVLNIAACNKNEELKVVPASWIYETVRQAFSVVQLQWMLRAELFHIFIYKPIYLKDKISAVQQLKIIYQD